jgi:CheY-like chemotaxis protein
MTDAVASVRDGAILPIDIPYILVVESDPEIAALLQQFIKDELGLSTLFAATVKDATKVTRVLKPIFFLINEHLSDGDGIALYDQLHQRAGFEPIPALILSSQPHLCQPRADERHVSCLEVPLNMDDLLSVLVSLLSLPCTSSDQRKVL